jgi:hypothetical protein
LRRIRSTRRGSTSAITGWSGTLTSSVLPTRSASEDSRSMTRCTTATRSVGSASSTANPDVEARDLQQVREQVLEPVQLGLEQSALRLTAGSKSSRAANIRSAAIRTLRQRRTQLRATVRGDRRCSRDISSSRTICRCRFAAIWLNERRAGQVVLAAHLHALVEQAGGQPLRGARGHPHRADHQPGHQRRQHAQQHHQGVPVGDTVVATRSAALTSASSGNR